jgi:hypothetical protein
MSLELCNQTAPIRAKRSLVTDGVGVLYATYNGLAYVQALQVSFPLTGLVSQEEWETYAPDSMIGAYYDHRYLLWYAVSANDRAALVFDKNVPDAPISTMYEYTEAPFVRGDTGRLYAVQNTDVIEFDKDIVNRTPFVWRSRYYILPQPVNFAYLRVHIDESVSNAEAELQAIQAANQALWAAGTWQAELAAVDYNEYETNGSPLLPLPVYESGFVTVQLVADDTLVFESSVLDDEPMRLPSGFLASRWEVVLYGNRPVRRVVLANSIAEISQL